MQIQYAELHCVSNFSFLRGASHPEELVERALALEYAGLALTDECSFAGSVRAHLALKDARENDEPARSFRLIHGTEIRLEDGPTLVLLATSRAGYGNLSQLVTLARRQAVKGSYRLAAADLEAHAGWLDDVLALLVPLRSASWLCVSSCNSRRMRTDSPGETSARRRAGRYIFI